MKAGMRFRHFTLVLLLVAAPAPARMLVGSYATWAAFCDEPKHCFAISMPAEQSDTPWLMVAVTDGGPVVDVRVGQPVQAAAVQIDDVRFDLTVAGDRVSADLPTSRRIVAAMRSGETLTVLSVGVHGGRRRQHYALAGGPSAIDAAVIAALR